MKRRSAIVAALVMAACVFLHANNLSVSAPLLTGKNTTAGTDNAANFVLVKFDVSWENSWRTGSAPNNWDAAWVFIKYKVGSGEWQHGTLNATGHTAPGGSTIAVAADGKGAFIHRSSDGSGSVNYTGVKLRWNYGADGVADNAQVTVKVFGLEMVHVAQGSFYVGSGGSEAGTLSQPPSSDGASTSFQITSESAITIGTDAGNLTSKNNGAYSGGIGSNGTLSASFPKGYQAFYCMKYQISQEQYVGFLNTLNGTQQAARISAVAAGYFMDGGSGSSTVVDRNGVKCSTAPVGATPGVYVNDKNGNGTAGETDDGQNISCNWLSWADGIAYSDWAGLRPMSELEFEKVCRGPSAAVAGEFAWGTASALAATSTTNNSQADEIVATPSGANANFDQSPGLGYPVRVGIFATASTSRSQAGASYYGAMDLSGDLWERVVSINDAGRSFTGTHGNGSLGADGNASGNSDWPGTSASGSGFRGGDWTDPSDRMRVSDRFIGAYTETGRTASRGFRSVRTAP